MAYVVKLDNLNFDGPLDLLLQLISKAKIDICDIFVSDITDQYLAHLRAMQEMDMVVTSEFLEMAALLVEIKSRALLPKVAETEEESPEELLLRRLEEYKACKEQAEVLREKAAETAGMVFRHQMESAGAQRMDIEFSFEALMQALDELLRRAEVSRVRPAKTQPIVRDRYSVQGAIRHVRKVLSTHKRVKFADLFETADREEIVVTFVALLELWRQGAVRIAQKGVYADIFVERRAA